MATRVHQSVNTTTVKLVDQGTGSPTTLVDRATSPIQWGNLNHSPQPEPPVEGYFTKTGNQWDQAVTQARMAYPTIEENPIPADLSEVVLQDFFHDLNSLDPDFKDFM